MCVALLALVPGYSEVQPRRPKGGPDGARDLSAVYRGQVEAWGAVGFRNGANDSSEDKRWVKAKFEADLEAAKRENPNLSVFVFFTNVDLTPKEQGQLQEYAHSKGIQRLDLFYRERLRIILDSPEGLGLRFQYLNIPLSDAEQAAFFERFGAELERLVLQGFDVLDRKLARIEFFHDCGKRLVDLRFAVALRSPALPNELAHFRTLMALTDFSAEDPHPALWLATRDAYATRGEGESRVLLPGVKTIAWSRNPDAELQNTVLGSLNAGRLAELVARTGVHKRGPFTTLGDLDRKDIDVYVTEPLVARIAQLGLLANGYWLVLLPITAFTISERQPFVNWPDQLSPEEREIKWMRLALRNDQPGPYTERRFFTDFDQYTPPKVRETLGSAV